MQHSAAIAGTILLLCSTCLISEEAAARPRSDHVAALGHIDGRPSCAAGATYRCECTPPIITIRGQAFVAVDR
jgi:hypothetical protein